MGKSSFVDIWSRIARLEGQEFHTITGLPFTFAVVKDAVFPSRTDYRLSKSDFETAIRLVPIEGPGKINADVRGPSYIWAILHDQRVSHGEW